MNKGQTNKTLQFDIKLQPRQDEAFSEIENGDSYIIGYGGAKFGGKSYLARQSMLVRRLNYNGTSGCIIRKTYPDLWRNHIRPFLAEYPELRQFYKVDHKSFEFPNGSYLDFVYLDTEEDIQHFWGVAYDDIYVDKAGEYSQEVLRKLATSLRQDAKIKNKYPNYKPKLFMTFNWGGIGHGELKRIFYDRDFDKTEYTLPDGTVRRVEDPNSYKFFPAKIWDNPLGMNANPHYLQTLINLPTDLRKAHLEGDPNVFVGQYFRKLNENKHLCEPFNIPSTWYRFRSLDWGYDRNTVCLWWAVDPFKNAYIYRGYKVNETVLPDLARNILKLTAEKENIISTFAGHDLWARIKTGEFPTNTTMADICMQNGLYLEMANNDRVTGWQNLMSYIEWGDLNIEPKLKIFDTYRWVFDDLTKLIHDEDKPEDVKKMRNDDTGDSARYGIMHIFEGKLEKEIHRTYIDDVIDKIEGEVISKDSYNSRDIY
jgi:hypothetical protein